MDIENRIWNEMIDAKRADYYTCYYLRRTKDKRRYLRIALIVVSVIGILLMNISSYIPSGVLALVVLVEVMKNLVPEIFPDEQLIEKLPEYRMKHVEKFERLDALYMKLVSGKISEDEALKQFFEIRKLNHLIEELDNGFSMPESKKLSEKANKDINTYVENHYGLSESVS